MYEICHMSTHCEQISIQLGRALQARRWCIATAESCTGGGVAQAITAIAGSSTWFEAGFVTYSNEAKQRMLGVNSQCFIGPDAPGAVSEEVAQAMAIGALRSANAQCSVSTTGIAGPDGGSAQKPVGTVFMGAAWLDEDGTIRCEVEKFHFPGDRKQVREASVAAALEFILRLINTE
jgi:nicotinamide-nucleotide amidase